MKKNCLLVLMVFALALVAAWSCSKENAAVIDNENNEQFFENFNNSGFDVSLTSSSDTRGAATMYCLVVMAPEYNDSYTSFLLVDYNWDKSCRVAQYDTENVFLGAISYDRNGNITKVEAPELEEGTRAQQDDETWSECVTRSYKELKYVMESKQVDSSVCSFLGVICRAILGTAAAGDCVYR